MVDGCCFVWCVLFGGLFGVYFVLFNDRHCWLIACRMLMCVCCSLSRVWCLLYVVYWSLCCLVIMFACC